MGPRVSTKAPMPATAGPEGTTGCLIPDGSPLSSSTPRTLRLFTWAPTTAASSGAPTAAQGVPPRRYPLDVRASDGPVDPLRDPLRSGLLGCVRGWGDRDPPGHGQHGGRAGLARLRCHLRPRPDLHLHGEDPGRPVGHRKL